MRSNDTFEIKKRTMRIFGALKGGHHAHVLYDAV
jgi:hypothetical protein